MSPRIGYFDVYVQWVRGKDGGAERIVETAEQRTMRDYTEGVERGRESLAY